MRIYNLFPLLAGPVTEWEPHLERAADLGFNWIYVNPIQQSGRSGSLYSIKDYFSIDKRFRTPGSHRDPEEEVREMTRVAAGLGLQMSTDLVINHCATDSALLEEHPEWFKRDGGKVANPYCVEEDGSRTVWRDLAQFDHEHSSDRDGLLEYCYQVVESLVDLGFKGLRCDAAYQLPTDLWRRLIERTKSAHPDVVFLAETLGCTPSQTRNTASAGFDYVFNSSKWWDFSSPWLLEQYELTRDVVPSISFPESHDTERLFSESGQNVAALKQRYLFAALFSSAVMMPIGYEFGFRRKLHVAETRPEHWEEPAVDLSDFIRHVNRIKADYSLFQEESRLQRLEHPNQALLLLWKGAANGEDQALLVFNKDPWNSQHFHCDDLYKHIQAPPPLLDLSPEWAMDHLPTPFEFDMGPGVGRVFVTQPH
jgi:starch synthase (maltosyl-transferring)